MNKVILSGRLARDPEVRYTGGQNMAIAKFTLAVDRRVKKEGEQNADFINCVAFGKTGEFIEKCIRKGSKVFVEGRWQTGSYTNKDGNKVFTHDCAVDNIEFGETKGTAAENPASQKDPRAMSNVDKDGFMNIPDGIDEELPFN